MDTLVNYLIYLLSLTVLDVKCCDPAELGYRYSLSWNGTVVSSNYVYWYSADIPVLYCSLLTSNCNNRTFFTGYVTKTPNNGIIAQLMFASIFIDFDHRSYSIQTDDKIYNVCDSLEVYNRSVSVTCASYFENEVFSYVTVRCVSSNVYPSAKITLSQENYKTNSDCQKDTSVEPYVARCVAIIPINYLKLGANNISVKIFPNVTQGERYSFQSFFTIALELPNVEITNCPMGQYVKEGYIKNGTSASCLCVLISPGYPPGQAQWYQIIDKSYNEVGTNEVNGSASITINVNHESGSVNFTCRGKSVLGMSSYDLYLPIKVVYPVEISRFTANLSTTSLVVPEKSVVVFQCDINSSTPATIQIIKRQNRAVANTSTVVSCEDSGEYVCQAIDLIFGTTQERSITVYVQCALQLTNTATKYYVYQAIIKTDLIIKIEVYGYPQPTSYTLFKRELDKEDHIVFSSSTKYKKYVLDYSIQSLPYGNLYLTIYNVTLVDFTNYTLIISNGWGSELVYRFSITEEIKTDSTSTSDILPAAIGGSVACAILIALIILLVIKRKDVRRIKSINCRKRHSNEDENTVEIPKTPVVRVSQRIQDTGYEEVNLEQNYDRLDQNEGETDQNVRYQQVSATRQYDEIDLSQVAIEQQYDPVTTKKKGSYQNYALTSSHI